MAGTASEAAMIASAFSMIRIDARCAMDPITSAENNITEAIMTSIMVNPLEFRTIPGGFCMKPASGGIGKAFYRFHSGLIRQLIAYPGYIPKTMFIDSNLLGRKLNIVKIDLNILIRQNKNIIF